MKKDVVDIFKNIVKKMPGAIYLKDTNGCYVACSEYMLKEADFKLESDVVGKNDYDLFPKDLADRLKNNDLQVIATGMEVNTEESIILSNGDRKFFQAVKVPFKDENGVIIGILGNSFDVTDRKKAELLSIETERQKNKLQEQEKFKKLVNQAAYEVKSPLAILLILAQRCSGSTRDEVFKAVEKLADVAPIPLWWVDEHNIVLGANKLDVQAIGGKCISNFIGKTQYDYLPFEIADRIFKHNDLVVQTRKVLSQDISLRDFTTGKIKHLTTLKAPLYDNIGKVIGVLCAVVDTTAEKEAKQLKLETEEQKTKLQEQDKFKKIADQVVHDIRSPLASLLMVLKSYEKDIPEQVRISLRDAAINITDIANTLLSKYEEDDFKTVGTEEHQPVMVALVLAQILSDKKHQYKEVNVKFTNDFCQKCVFTFIKAQPSAFKRMLSNLVNNAVEALAGKKGTVHLDLSLDNNKVKIVIQDNGKGMSQETINKILNNLDVVTDKKEGHGIGLTQIRETLKHNQGKLAIESKLGEGTKMILTFPIIGAPDWITKGIKVNKGDTIVILDDDRSIHGAWDSRFKDHLNEVRLKHFLIGNKVIDFINTFSKKDKIFLLTDFELLKQDLNGIDIIQKTGIKRAILVTSHHAEVEVRNLAIENGIKILPKQLASDVPIEICEANIKCISAKKPKKVDIVVIDDDEILGDSMVLLFKNYNKTADRYQNPKRFLDKISQYDKNTQIFIDNNFGSNNITGIELAKQLHKKSFTKLYLFSGKDFAEGEVPDYLKLIPKTDIDGLCKAIE